MSSPTAIRIALDWTPNTLHSGLFLALAQGLYSKANLDVTLLPPDHSYTVTPAKRLEQGTADLAIVPSESVIAYAESNKDGVKLQAIYAICQKDASAIVSATVAEVGLLGEGKSYGSYNARYEDGIIRELIQQGGGNGDGLQIERQTGKKSLFNAVKKGHIDATWVFMPWEGVEAEMEGVKLNVFPVSGWTEGQGVPYGYSPVIARNCAGNPVLSDEVTRAFCKATAEGYQFAMEERNLHRILEVMRVECSPKRSDEFLEKSQRSINAYYGEDSGAAGMLGRMKSNQWKIWVQWLKEKGLAKADLDEGDLFTNDFLG